jgi:hypothetical protein
LRRVWIATGQLRQPLIGKWLDVTDNSAAEKRIPSDSSGYNRDLGPVDF